MSQFLKVSWLFEILPLRLFFSWPIIISVWAKASSVSEKSLQKYNSALKKNILWYRINFRVSGCSIYLRTCLCLYSLLYSLHHLFALYQASCHLLEIWEIGCMSAHLHRLHLFCVVIQMAFSRNQAAHDNCMMWFFFLTSFYSTNYHVIKGSTLTLSEKMTDHCQCGDRALDRNT